MYQQQQSPRPEKGPDLGGFFVSALAFPLIMLLHRDIGSRFVGMNGFFSILFMLIAPAIWPGRDPFAEYWFLGLVLLMCVKARFAAWRRESIGAHIHRQSIGWPWILRWYPKVNVRGYVLAEPILVAILAFQLIGLSHALVGVLISSAFGLMVLNFVHEETAKEKVARMKDQEWEMRDLHSRFREGSERFHH